MPLYQLDVEKYLGGEYWTNVYHLMADDLAQASTKALLVVDAERHIHSTYVAFTKFRVSDTNPNNGFFYTGPVNLQGLYNTPGDFIPLWNVARVDFGVSGHRPSKKFLRVPLSEGMQNSGDLSAAVIGDIIGNYCTPLLQIPVCAKNGEGFDSALPYPRVSMRQLRRGSKRRTQPIIP